MKRPRSKIALGVLVALVAAFLLAELAFRVGAWTGISPWSTERLVTDSRIDDASGDGPGSAAEEDTSLPEFTLHPYLGWTQTPGVNLASSMPPGRLTRHLRGGGDRRGWPRLPAGKLGFVTPQELPYQRGSNEYVITVLGGSVARFFTLQGGERFLQTLRADERFGNKELVLIDAATGAHKQPQQLLTLSYLLALGHQTDLVLNLDGFNEAAIGLENLEEGVAAIYPNHRIWSYVAAGSSAISQRARSAIALVEWARAKEEKHRTRAGRWAGVSNLASFLSLRFAQHWERIRSARIAAFEELIAEEGDAAQAQIRTGFGDDGLSGESARSELVEIWSRSSRALHALCDGRGITYFHALQPTARDDGQRPSKRLTSQEEELAGDPEAAWAQAVRATYPALRRAGAELAAEGVRFLDLSFLFEDVEETLYCDICHFDQPANELLAERLAAALLAAWDE